MRIPLQFPDCQKDHFIINNIFYIVRIGDCSHRREGISMNNNRLRPMLFQGITSRTQIDRGINRCAPMIK